MKNLIYISYGIPRSGSTFLYQITKSVLSGLKTRGYFQGDARDAFEAAGIPWREELFINNPNDLFDVATKLENIELNSPFAIVIKTHCFPSPLIETLLQSPNIKANCIWRDPIEVAKSIFAISADEQSAKEKESRFDKYDSITDTIDGVLQSCNAFLWWANQRNVINVAFNELITKPDIVAKDICKQISITGELDVNYISDWYLQDKTNRIGEYRLNGGGRLKLSEIETEALSMAFKTVRENLEKYQKSSLPPAR